MKTRLGFVSNSSSSSFIIGCSGDLRTHLNKYKITDNPFSFIIDETIDCIIKNCEKYNKSDFMQEHYVSEEEFEDEYSREYEIFNKFDNVYYGSVCNETCDSMENMLSYLNVNIKTDNFEFYKEAF